MTESSEIYSDTLAVYWESQRRFSGMLVAEYAQVIDAMHLPKSKQEIERLSERLGEPVMLRMGHYEALYIPFTERTQYVFGLSEGQQGWLPWVDCFEETVCGNEDVTRLVSMSGASGGQPVTYKLECPVGIDIAEIEKRLRFLGQAGISVTSEGNGDDVLSSNPVEVRYGSLGLAL